MRNVPVNSRNMTGATPQESAAGLIDQIEIAIDLPTGPIGPQGEATEWITGEGPPTADLVMPIGTLYLQDSRTGSGGNGDYYQYTESGWLLKGNLEGPPGTPGPHDHTVYAMNYDSEIASSLTVYGWGHFDSTVTGAYPTETNHLATKAYVDERYADLAEEIQASAIQRFIGQTAAGVAALPAVDDNWNMTVQQGIYQTTGGGHQPPGEPSSTILGLVMSSSPGNCAQIVISLDSGMLYSRIQRGNSWGGWQSLVPFQAPFAPTNQVTPPGSIWLMDEDQD